jgi:hypothetical protein
LIILMADIVPSSLRGLTIVLPSMDGGVIAGTAYRCHSHSLSVGVFDVIK